MDYQHNGTAAGVRTRRARRALNAALAMLTAAIVGCADSSTPPPTSPLAPSMNRSEGRGIFQRYVALGSGMSMGWRSGEVTAASQFDSWPAQLARIAHRELDQPYPGVKLPTQNLAVRGATVSSALLAMVGGAVTGDSGFGFTGILPLVLPPGVTQVGAVQMLKPPPKIVSVEYGTSELLRSMMTPIPDVTRLIPSVPAWSGYYDQILDAVTKSTDMVVLALPAMTPPPGFIPASVLESWLSTPQALTEFNVAPPPSPCQIMSRLVYAPAYLGMVISEALTARANGLDPIPLNCNLLGPGRTDLGFSLDTWDMIQSADQGMRVHIMQEAERRGFAVFDLGDLYTSFTQPAFNLFTYWNSSAPFGPYVSRDGIFPTAEGNALLARAAARALNETYDLGLPVSAVTARVQR